MKRVLNADHGQDLLTAAKIAVTACAKETATLARMRMACTFWFDYHGIQVPLPDKATPEDLERQVSSILRDRARLYDRADPPENAAVCKRRGLEGARLSEAITLAVCHGQREGNHAWEVNPMDIGRLRHVFEFNGVEIPFNPWKHGEADRLLHAMEAQLAKVGKEETLAFA